MMSSSMNVVINIGAKDAQRNAYAVQIQHEGKPLADDWVQIDRQALLENEHQLSAHDYGMELCDALLTKKLDRAYQRLIGQATAETMIRVQLVIHPDAPELHALPWERLFHVFGNAETPLSTDARTPFSRFLVSGAGDQPPVRERPLRFLVAVANPTDLPDGCSPLDVEGEVTSLADLLTNSAGRVQGTLLAGRSGLSKDLQARLIQQGWTIVEGFTSWQAIQRHLPGHHIVHILAHGQFKAGASPGVGTAYLLLEQEGSGSVEYVPDDDIITGLAGVHPLPHLVFLAACDSAKRPEAGTATIGANPFIGLAPKLVEAGVPAVVAMQDEAPINLARMLAADFYRRLFDHGLVDRALNEARSLVYERNTFEWAIPVLFLRLKDGLLFAKQSLEPPSRVIFDGVIERHTKLFAGREAESHDLEQFMADPAGGYLLVTAGAGLGKTALMANLVARHRDVAYHFFTPTLPESLDETWFLHSLLEQVGLWYGLIDPPMGQREDMRKRYDAFLGLTPQGIRTVVLDGLDEVTNWDLSRYLTRNLPPGLHFILTIRHTEGDPDPITKYALPVEQVRSVPVVGLTREGVRAVLRAAGGSALQFTDDSLLDQVMEITACDVKRPELGADTFYVRFLAEDAAAPKKSGLTPKTIGQWPKGLSAYLDKWLAEIRVAAEKAKGKIARAVNDLLFTLVAALGPINRADLQAIHPSLRGKSGFSPFPKAVAQIRRFVAGSDAGGYVLFHPRLREYMRTHPDVNVDDYQQKLLTYCAQWPQHQSRYALMYFASHLAQAAAVADRKVRHAQTESLVSLVTDRQFQDSYLAVVKDFSGLQADLQRGLKAAAEDETPEALPLLVDSALSLVRFRRERLRPEYFFDLAAQGDIVGARRMLELFEMDTKWQHIVLLETTWLAGTAESEHGRDQARALRMEVTAAIHDLPADDQRQMLLRWIEADLEGKPWPQGNLPSASTPAELRATLDAAGGVSPEPDISPEMLMSVRGINWNLVARGIESLGEVDEMSEEMFISYYIGPSLVALAYTDPKGGMSYLKEYLGIHSAYSYANYRFGSSWALLRPILQYPEPGWVKEQVRLLLIAALGGGSLEFEEGLPLTVLALRAFGCAKATKDLVKYTARFQQEARELGPVRGVGDTWGRYKRLLATLAQAQAIIGANVGASSHDLLNDALWLHYGYAGYQAPACLTLAEAIHICHPTEENNWITWTLESAQQAAHNIQEGTFCARTTARVNAMRQQWWSSSALDVRTEIATLRTDPRSERFASQHYVGHSYGGRGNPPRSFPLPNRLRDANTLAMLATAYQRGLPEFLRLNRDWEPEQMIPPGTAIYVPDPGMLPLLAARLAAEVLIVAGLTQEERVALIRSLVPTAAANPTVLDTVLARLLLAEQPIDPAILKRLADLAPIPADVQTGSLRGELTVVQP